MCPQREWHAELDPGGETFGWHGQCKCLQERGERDDLMREAQHCLCAVAALILRD